MRWGRSIRQLIHQHPKIVFYHSRAHGLSKMLGKTPMLPRMATFSAGTATSSRSVAASRSWLAERALRALAPTAAQVEAAAGAAQQQRQRRQPQQHHQQQQSHERLQQQQHPAPASAPGGGDATGAWQRAARLGAALAIAGAAAAAAAGPAHAAELAELANSLSFKIPGLIGDSQFVEGLVSGFLLIFFSEIGDKTFFIALLLALKEDRGAVFAGTFGALAVMTVISVALGRVFHQLDELLPANNIPFDDLLAVALLLFFGISTLKGAADADARAAEEKEEAGEVVSTLGAAGTAALVASTFGLVFAAEWGDKSFLATIALAAASDPAGVITGAVMGHGVATGIAVAGGGLLSKYISERTANYIGGSLFLVFAAATVYDIITGAHTG
ncbi:MAG: hypothetical protein J3K34DRAFT_242929 [Monoraphidium minutum]|nr:MAG: hypothetical protein J3K34DRAFT_242929 [Monoraphidium minutum]